MQPPPDAVARLDYSNQRAVPDHQTYLDSWRDASLAARTERPGRLDIQYGAGWRESADIFGAGASGAPVLVFVHGGWWHFLDKSDFSYVAAPYVERGAVCVCINYPLAPRATIGEISASVRKALLWTHAHIADFGGDPQRIAVAGHSAGGHLAALMGFTDWTQFGAPPDVVKTSCSVSGLYDLRPILHAPHNERIGMDATTAAQWSPIDHIRPNGTRHIACVGGDETTGFHWQHQAFLGACRHAGVAVQDASLDGRHHFDVIDQIARPESRLFQALWAAMTAERAVA